jgi:hypothetical protein
MDDMDYKNGSESSKKFVCKNCDYLTCRQSQYDRHTLTTKHLRMTNGDTIEKNIVEKVPREYKCECGNIYKYRQGISKHKKTCNFQKKQKEENIRTTPIDASNNMIIPYDMFMQLMKQNSDFKELMMDQNKQMVSLFEKGVLGNTINNTTNTNSHNVTNKNRFNINLFLNEKCKDAMNIMDFVNTMQLQLSDLERVGELGYVKGISNIVVNKLKDLDVHKRPIHCSDIKRETMYVKDQDIWEKENEKKEKLSKMITHVAHKNQKQINEWQKENPEYKDCESVQSEKYLKIVGESMNGLTNDDDSCCYTNKIIKNIAKEVLIEKEE